MHNLHIWISAIPLLFVFAFSGCTSISVHKTDEVSVTGLESIQLAPDVTFQMLRPEYWISQIPHADRVIMTQQQIAEWNRAAYGANLINNFDAYINGVDKAFLLRVLAKYNPEHLWYTEQGPVPESTWQLIRASMGISGIQDHNPVQPAVCVRRSSLRTVPSYTFYTNDLSDWYDDMGQTSGILMNEPVLILWHDTSGNWLYVMTRFCCGWIRKENIALCHDYTELQRIAEMEHFVTITEDEISLTSDYISPGMDAVTSDIPAAAQTWISRLAEKQQAADETAGQNAVTDTAAKTSDGTEAIPADDAVLPEAATSSFISDVPEQLPLKMCTLYMGTRLETISWNDPEIYRKFLPRIPYTSYAVRIPCRGDDGYLTYIYASLPAGIATYGALPYTAENVLRLAFKPLGRRYGWGGQYYSRDCSEFSMEVYRCFGFILPRNSRGQNAMPGKTVHFTSDMTEKQRQNLLRKTAPGSILFLPGHIMIYLGHLNSSFYVLSAMGTYYSGQEPAGTEINAFSININTLAVKRRNGNSWLKELVSAKEMR